jgi:putative DNA primase/helicase
MLQHILGSYAIRMPVEAVMQHDRSAGATPDMVRLQGARLALTTELDEGKAFAGPAIKNTTGGDRLVARALYANPVEFDPTHKLLLYGNHKPRVTGTDHGIWRRMRLIPFTVTISDEQRDPHLIDKLKAETDAILGWMVRGCLQWQRDGLGMPAAVRKATESYRIESDAVGRFIEECCDLAEGVETEKPVLYALFKAWCETNGESVLSAKAFHPRLVAKGVLEGRKNKVRTWIGISIREGTA